MRVSRLNDPLVVWAVPGQSDDLRLDINQWLLTEHAVVLEGATLFESQSTATHHVVGSVERYGGAGIGQNGGGARCLNYEAQDPSASPNAKRRIFQAKGTGANIVVGQHDDNEHSYGGLDARKAIVETIYTNVLGRILPLGTVKIFGLLFTGHESAFNGERNCWGVIMIRDHCLRPAHFLKARDFKPLASFESNYPGELARMRLLYKRLSRRSGGHHEFIKYLGRFLRNAANQFSFAKIARIMHGTLTASNLSMDGRWLDLPVASFLSGGVNYNFASSVFYGECREPLAYALEMLHNYSKFNNIDLNPSALIRYYEAAFGSYFKSHLHFVLGVPIKGNGSSSILEHETLIYIATLLSGVIHRDRKISMERPRRGDPDPVVAFIVGCFCSMRDMAAAERYFELAQVDLSEAKKIADNFSRLLDEYARLLDMPEKSRSTGIDLNFFFVALKRCLLTSAFYLPVVDDEVKNLCQNGSPADISAFIDGYSETSEWVFDGDVEHITLYKRGDFVISYSDEIGYHVCLDGEQLVFRDFFAFYNFVKCIDKSKFVVNGYDYSFFFEQLNRLIPTYEVAARSASIG